MAAEKSRGGEEVVARPFQIDEAYEFSAPKFFDFINGETEEEMRTAELWFERDHSYAPSPFMPRIKKERAVQPESLCKFEDDGQIAASVPDSSSCSIKSAAEIGIHEPQRQGVKETTGFVKQVSLDNPSEDGGSNQKDDSFLPEKSSIMAEANSSSSAPATEACTPLAQPASSRRPPLPSSSKNQTAKKIASLVRNPSALKLKNESQLPSDKSARSVKPKRASSLSTDKRSVNKMRCPGSAAKSTAAAEIALENQAIKRQKLDEGRSRQILNVKNHVLPHKSNLRLTNGNQVGASANKCGKESKENDPRQRKVYVREQINANPFISTAELAKKFQSNTRRLQLPPTNKSLSRDDADSMLQRRQVLKLTRPQEPEFHTIQRLRPTKMKSTAELEEEMLANMPKFKARPLNKKILAAPTLPAPPRSTPHLPEFQEFHLKTMERAAQHPETSSSSNASRVVDNSCQNHQKHHKLTEPKTPHLETSLRARPMHVKSSQELEQEELDKMPKFKARPLNKKILESKGSVGVFCNLKPQITVPHEFHFATDERLPPPTSVFDLFEKLSLKSESCHEQRLPRTTTPNPFHLHTEERGTEKERRFVEELLQKQLEEERARIPKAYPYPYTTDIPVVPPKPEPKKCTKPEAFQLASLVRHEEEIQKKLEEKERREREEAQMRHFKAQPIMKEDPIPLPEKVRKPLTEVQKFALHVDHRAVDRSEFDKKVMEKEMMYKRYREEFEMNQKIEEEKEVKQMRRTMVPHARPVPNFANPFLPQRSSKETTKAKSPKLRVLRKERRRVGSAAAATDMR
ncbi:protein TPX2-like isoform X2 [Aristolochia californica]|uniref:protein TPX2-like isoform X2 n=1 Tax=Aristolochia californica TaxID=171875 RepID=UPI0035D78416